jgi:hypothetical protein
MTGQSGARERTRAIAIMKVVLINLVVLVTLLVVVEIGVRALLLVSRGSATAGLQERTLNLDYEPFVMFGPGWDARFAAVPRDGLPVVLLVGGSTAEGLAPEILEAALRQRFGTPIRVVNAAFGGYEARQEVVVASIWGPSLRPAAIVSLDGHNDLEHRLRVPAPGRFFLDGSYRTYLTHPMAAPFAWLLSQSQAYNSIVRFQARRSLGEWTTYADAIPVYASAIHAINMVARGIGSARLMVLQPFVGFKDPLAAEERAFTAYAYRDGVMRALYDHAATALAGIAREDGVGFLDARPIYHGIPAPLFTDDVHFRDRQGYDILSRAIADALPGDTFSRRQP